MLLPPDDPASNIFTIGRGVGIPARRLVVDLYVHHNFPAVRGACAHAFRPGILGALGDAHPRSRWFDRLPVEHDILLLSGAPGDRSIDVYPRIGELTRHVQSAMQWAGQPFTGYRLDIEYPLFDIQYVLQLDLISPNRQPISPQAVQ